MNLELGQYNLQNLVNLHQEANKRLKASLLAGQSWEELQEQLAFVTQLSVMIDQKQHPDRSNIPLAYPFRDTEQGTRNED